MRIYALLALVVLCTLTFVNCSCADHPLHVWKAECSTGIPNVTGYQDETSLKETFELSARTFLETGAKQEVTGICPHLALKESCCDERAYSKLADQLTDMYDFLFTAMDDVVLITDRAVFSLEFLYWAVDEILEFVMDLFGDAEFFANIKDEVETAFGIIRTTLKYITGITKAALDINHYVLPPKQCTDLPRKCEDVDQCTQKDLPACIEEYKSAGGANNKACLALSKKCTEMKADCDALGTISQPSGCGDLYKCYQGALVLSSGTSCLMCESNWSDYIDCNADKTECTIKVDKKTAQMMNTACAGFALDFIPNTLERVFAYVFNDILECDPGQEKLSVTKAELETCQSSKREATCSSAMTAVVGKLSSSSTTQQCYDAMVKQCEANERGVKSCKEHMAANEADIKERLCPAIIGQGKTASDICPCFKTDPNNDTELCVPYWPNGGAKDSMFSIVITFMGLIDMYKDLIKGLNAVGMGDVLLANLLIGESQGMDVGFVLKNTALDEDYGMATPMGMILDVSDWIWDTFWGWLPQGSGSTMDMVIKVVVGYFTRKFSAETGIPVPMGVPGHDAGVVSSVYEAYFTPAEDPRLPNRLWAKSRGGLALEVGTPGVYRYLESRGLITKEQYRKPGFSLSKLVQNDPESAREVDAALQNSLVEEGKMSEYDIATLSEPTMQVRDGGCTVSYGTEGTTKAKVEFVETGGYPAWTYGCNTGIAGEGCTLVTLNLPSRPQTLPGAEKALDILDEQGMSALRKWIEQMQDKYGDWIIYVFLAAPLVLVLIMGCCCYCCCCKAPKIPGMMAGAPPPGFNAAAYGMAPPSMARGGFGMAPSMGARGGFGAPPSMGMGARGGFGAPPSMGAPRGGFGGPGGMRGRPF